MALADLSACCLSTICLSAAAGISTSPLLPSSAGLRDERLRQGLVTALLLDVCAPGGRSSAHAAYLLFFCISSFFPSVAHLLSKKGKGRGRKTVKKLPTYYLPMPSIPGKTDFWLGSLLKRTCVCLPSCVSARVLGCLLISSPVFFSPAPNGATAPLASLYARRGDSAFYAGWIAPLPARRVPF
jgi:hypothetical protein